MNALANKITNSIRIAARKVCSLRKPKNLKISPNTEILIEERRKIDRDSPRYEGINKTVKKAIKKDIRSYNTQLIKQVIENNANMRVLRSGLSRGRLVIHKMKNNQGEVIVERSKITEIIENFYRKLYDQSVPAPDNRGKPREAVLNVGSEDLQMIDGPELRAALRQLKNSKAPGEDLVTGEMLKIGGDTLEQALLVLLNKCLEEGRIPDQWQNAEVVLLFKKGDCANIENYRPISLLSIFYKLLTKILTNRLTQKFDFYQPVEQAGFRRGYSTREVRSDGRGYPYNNLKVELGRSCGATYGQSLDKKDT